MNKLTFKEWSTLSDLQTIVSLKEDEEFSMARGELKTAKSAIERLMRHLKGEGNLEAWVQSKITKASEYLDTVADHMDSGEDETKDVSEMISTSALTGKPYRDISNKRDQKDLEKERSKRKKEKEEKYKKSLESLRDQTREKGIRFYDKKGSGYIKDGQKQYDESIELHDANGNLFAHVVDIIRGSNYKFRSFTQPINEDAVEELEVELKKLDNTSYDSIDKLMRNIMKEHDMTAKELHNAFVKKHDKTPDEWVKGLNEKCWDGYKQVGMKKKGKKVVPNCVKEEGLRDWFGKSKSKDGKPGWVNVVTGGTCASDEPGEGTPKCVSSSKRASMTDEERKSASRRKKSADPGQQSKSGAAKPTYVATDVKEESDKKGKGSGTKDACYTKVKSRYSVWPSAYASGALVKCRKVGAANWGNKSESVDTNSLAYDWEYPIAGKMERYCPKCKKNETMKECRYGEGYWKMFSIPSSLAPDPYDPNDIHPANEGVSFEIGSGHKQAQKQTKIRNLATGTTNPNEKSAALRKLSGPSLPLADSVIQPGQLTNEDYQRIQSTGNVYTILFSWRGRPMMNLQLFFPNMKRPSKEEVKTQVEKLYPGAIIMQWYPSPTDPSKPIVVIQK
jgi:hypothetical protein